MKPASFAERFWAKVDKSGDCWEWTCAKNKKGYGRFLVDGHNRLAHRVSYELCVGHIAAGMQIDHRCQNSGCVNPCHLRQATNKQNMENTVLHGGSGMRGVNWDKRSKKWVARVRHNTRQIYLGSFDSMEEAGAVALNKRLELFTFNDQDRTVNH